METLVLQQRKVSRSEAVIRKGQIVNTMVKRKWKKNTENDGQTTTRKIED